MEDTHAAVEAVHQILSVELGYGLVLVAFVFGLGGMILSKNRQAYLALGSAIAWIAIFLAFPGEAEGMKDDALLNAAELIFFLIPVMTMIEMGVHYGMMNAILRLINTTSMRMLVVIVGLMSFVFSAVLDNLTAAIVMAVLVTQLMRKSENRIIFACLIVVAANAGGVPSAIGNTTSILLWVKGQLTIGVMFKELIFPSLMYMLVIFGWFMMALTGTVERPVPDELDEERLQQSRSLRLESHEQWSVLFFLLVCIGSVIILKVAIHLDPLFGAAGAFGIFSLVTGYMNKRKGELFMLHRSVHSALTHVDWSTVKMFMYMLPLVSAAGAVGILDDLATVLIHGADTFGSALGSNARVWIVAIMLGIISMIVPNTPLVAAAQQMFPPEVYGQNDLFWVLLNYSSGVGGSLLLLGSGAGVVIASRFRGDLSASVYVKTMTLPAFLAFASGLVVVYVQHVLF